MIAKELFGLLLMQLVCINYVTAGMEPKLEDYYVGDTLTCNDRTVSARDTDQKCRDVGAQGNCQEYERFMLTAGNKGPVKCRGYLCEKDEAWVEDKGKCTKLGKSKYCPKGTKLELTESEHPKCACPVGRVWDTTKKRCVITLKRNSCPKGHITLPPAQQLLSGKTCIENDCKHPGQLMWREVKGPAGTMMWNENGQKIGCFYLVDSESGCESMGMLRVQNGQIICDNEEDCGAGNMLLKDMTGRCRVRQEHKQAWEL